MKKSVLVIYLVICSIIVFSQDDNYYTQNFIRNQDHIYHDNIKTVQLYKDGWEMSPPIVQLNTDEKLFLSFDDLDSDLKNYKMTLIHCDANWEVSDMDQSEYLESFSDDDINDNEFSFNTTKAFTYYYATLPSDYLEFNKSGNYILRVFEEEDLDENVAFTRRFMVVDPKVSISGRVGYPTNVSERDSKQGVDFKIDRGTYYIADPFRDLNVMIRQNGRWDNMITDIKPRLVSGSELDYRYLKENVFDGGNEFREFNIKSMNYNSERIQRIEYDIDGYNVYLHPDEKRVFKRYTFDNDINGKYVIESENSHNNQTESDYVFVHFFLPNDVPLVNGNLYVIGELTDWQFSEAGKMIYDYEQHIYYTTLYLKQGYYNYMYVFLEDGYPAADMSYIEGNHFETENDYTIYVYHHEEGTRYDQLIGVYFLNSLIK